VIPSLSSWNHYRLTGPSFDALRATVWSSLHLLTRAHCAQCSSSIPLCSASQVLAQAGENTESSDCSLCMPVSHDRRTVCLPFLLVPQAFWAWWRSRFQQPNCGYPPQSQSTQIPTSEQLLWAHWRGFCAAHLFLRLSPLGTPSPCPLTV